MWESNHVWLIIAIVVLWTGFPLAFADVFTTLFVPLSVAALGIVLRGSRLRVPRPGSVAAVADGELAACSPCPRC